MGFNSKYWDKTKNLFMIILIVIISACVVVFNVPGAPVEHDAISKTVKSGRVMPLIMLPKADSSTLNYY